MGCGICDLATSPHLSSRTHISHHRSHITTVCAPTPRLSTLISQLSILCSALCALPLERWSPGAQSPRMLWGYHVSPKIGWAGGLAVPRLASSAWVESSIISRCAPGSARGPKPQAPGRRRVARGPSPQLSPLDSNLSPAVPSPSPRCRPSASVPRRPGNRQDRQLRGAGYRLAS
jgi:hypothetical protein